MSKRPPIPLDKIPSSSPEKKHATEINTGLRPASYVMIQQDAGSCWTGLLICQKCKMKPTSYALLNDWFMELHCGKCNRRYKVCTLCPFNKKQFFNVNDVKKHKNQHSHRNKELQKKIPLLNEVTNAQPECNEFFETSTIAEIEPDPELINFLGTEKLKYFLMESTSNGNAHLYASSFYPQHRINLSSLNSHDINFSLLLANFIQRLTKPLRIRFTTLMKNMKSYMLPSTEEKPLYSLSVPVTTSQLRATYTDGKTCFLEQIPLPDIQIKDSDICMSSHTSLLECFKHFLAFGHGVNEVNLEDTIFDGNKMINVANESRMAHKNIKHVLESFEVSENSTTYPKFLTFFTVFSDGFDPTVSLVKSNRFGIWVLQVCFLRTWQDDESDNTYVISLSGKGAKHDDILKSLEDEIFELSTGKCPPLYHGGLKKIVQPILFPLLRHADQPERREIYGTKLGKGSNHARWRYSCNFNEVGMLLPSCETCKKHVVTLCMESKWNSEIGKCKNCSNWEFLNHDDILRWKPPKYYPTDMVPESGYLHPMELNTDLLKFSAILTHNKVSKNEWNASTANKYLSSFCVSTNLADRIIDHALNVRLLNEMKEKNDPIMSVLEADKQNNPMKYNPAVLPPMWYSSQPMSIYPDTPMHLFSGIVKAVIKLSFRVLKEDGKLESYLRILKESKNINTISCMNLSWFPLMCIASENFPGMGSNNHLATGRFLKLLGLLLENVKQKAPTEFPPNETQHTWNKALNIEWLRLRDLDVHGSAKELRERVSTYITSDDCPTVTKKKNVSIKDLQRMYASTTNALSHLMTKYSNDTHAELTYQHVKRLLSDIEHIDSQIRTSTEKPVWAQKYNLLCLLNCKEDMIRYGPPRCRWEGDSSGEKNIQSIKNGFKGFHTNWALNTHKTYFVNKTMSKLEKNRQNYIQESKSIYFKENVIHTYASPQDASSCYLLGKPLCMVLIKNSDDFGVLHTGNRFWKLQELKFEKEISHVCCFKLELSSTNLTSVEVSEDMIKNVCMAIPHNGIYVILDMEWKELDKNLQFVYGYK